jgi:hypothetical protein
MVQAYNITTEQYYTIVFLKKNGYSIKPHETLDYSTQKTRTLYKKTRENIYQINPADSGLLRE